ncbi:MAG: beta-N-acetylhexosaminidase [Rikenellaceae bacterium]
MIKSFVCSAALTLLLAFSGCNTPTMPSDVIIPKPNSTTVGEGVLTIKNGVQITSTASSEVTEYTKNALSDKFSLSTTQGKIINLNIDTTSIINPEGYILEVTSKGININGSTSQGVFYGVQSLIQLMEAGKVEGAIKIQNMRIEDAPRFAWRSYMLDEARHFFGEENIYRIIDVMAELKLNVLHWHLTDDAGWRIEIKQYPLLTEIGSKRADTEIGTWGSNKTAGKPHSGYYTQEQIKSIVKYAKERNIKIIPEIEMPGHASASVAAYPWLSTKNEKIEVPVKFGKHYYTYDVIDTKVQEFLKNVIDEVIELFDTDVIHIGGDEVRFDHWEADAGMRAHKRKNGYSSYMDIQIEFTNMMSRYIESKECSMMGWNEILGTNLHADDNISFSETSTKIAPNVVVQFWKGDINELTKAAEQGYRLVNSYHSFTYLDYSYGNIPLAKAYSFDPIPDNLDEKYHKNIVGFGCQMWTEWVPDVDVLNRQTFPRIAAYAEVGWSEKEVKDFDNFTSRMPALVERWKEKGIVGYDSPELQPKVETEAEI